MFGIKADVNQSILINRLNVFCIKHHLTPLAKLSQGDGDVGFCAGLSILWGYAHLLSCQPQDDSRVASGKKRHDIEWFGGVVDKLAAWNMRSALSVDDQKEIEELLSLMILAQLSHKFISSQQQNFEISILDTKNRFLKTKSVCDYNEITISELSALLKKLEKNQIYYFTTNTHAVSVFLKINDFGKKEYYYYDSNYYSGQRVSSDTDIDVMNLSRNIAKDLFFKGEKISFEVRNISFSDVGEKQDLRKLINKDIPDSTYSTEKYPLHAAAFKRDSYNLRQLLLSHKKQLFEQDELGWTAHQAAGIAGDEECFKLLLIAADLEKEKCFKNFDNLVFTLLKNGKLNILTLLIQFGFTFNPKAKDESGKILLHWAAHWGDHKLCEWLVSRGFNVNAADSSGKTPLNEAIENHGDINLVKWFVEHDAVRGQVDRDGNSLFLSAVMGGDVDIASFFLEEGLEDEHLEYKNKEGNNALFLSVIHESFDVTKKIFELMQDRCIDYISPNDAGETVLTKACQRGHLAMVQYFVENNFEPTLQDLAIAAEKDFQKITEFLIENFHKKLNAESGEQGDTLLHVACRSGSMENVSFVLKKYPHLTKVLNKHGKTFFHCACESGNLELLSLLQNAYPDDCRVLDAEGFGAVSYYCKSKHQTIDGVRGLISHGHKKEKIKNATVMPVAMIDFLRGENMEVEGGSVSKGRDDLMEYVFRANNVSYSALKVRNFLSSQNCQYFPDILDKINVQINVPLFSSLSIGDLLLTSCFSSGNLVLAKVLIKTYDVPCTRHVIENFGKLSFDKIRFLKNVFQEVPAWVVEKLRNLSDKYNLPDIEDCIFQEISLPTIKESIKNGSIMSSEISFFRNISVRHFCELVDAMSDSDVFWLMRAVRYLGAHQKDVLLKKIYGLQDDFVSIVENNLIDFFMFVRGFDFIQEADRARLFRKIKKTELQAIVFLNNFGIAGKFRDEFYLRNFPEYLSVPLDFNLIPMTGILNMLGCNYQVGLWHAFQPVSCEKIEAMLPILNSSTLFEKAILINLQANAYFFGLDDRIIELIDQKLGAEPSRNLVWHILTSGCLHGGNRGSYHWKLLFCFFKHLDFYKSENLYFPPQAYKKIIRMFFENLENLKKLPNFSQILFDVQRSFEEYVLGPSGNLDDDDLDYPDFTPAWIKKYTIKIKNLVELYSVLKPRAPELLISFHGQFSDALPSLASSFETKTSSVVAHP